MGKDPALDRSIALSLWVNQVQLTRISGVILYYSWRSRMLTWRNLFQGATCMPYIPNPLIHENINMWPITIFSYWVTTENILARVLNLKCSILISLNYGLSFCELKATNQFSFIFFSVFLTQGNAFCKRVFIFNGFFNEFFSQAINNAINYRQLVLKCTLAS